MTATDETTQGYWLGVHWVWLVIAGVTGLFTTAVVYYALITVNLMCVEYPNFYRSFIAAPSLAGVGGALAGISVGAFWWMVGFVYETCNAMQSVAYGDQLEDEEPEDA